MKYLIWGYYGFGNLGDDLMLLALRDGIRRRDPHGVIYVRCQAAPRVDGVIPFDVEALRPPKILPVRLWRFASRYLARVCRQIDDSEVLVIGGGTLFVDKGRHNRSLLELLFFASYAKARGKKVVAVGVGLDKLQHPLSKIYFKRLLRLLDGAWFRETYGYEIARSIVPEDGKVTHTADLVYSLAWPDREKNGARKKLGIVLADVHAYYGTHPGIGRDALLDAFAAFLKKASGSGLEPAFLVFQPGTGFQGDRITADLLKRAGLEGKSTVHMLTTDIPAIAAVYRDLAYLVGMHFHALVLASIYEVPFIGINHEHKFEDVCGRYAMPCLPLQHVGETALSGALERIRQQPIDRTRVEKDRGASEHNFEWVKP